MIRAVLLAMGLTAALGLAGETEASTIMGSGASSCSTWLTEERANGPQWDADQEWLAGFLTSYSINRREKVDPLANSLDGVVRAQWVSRYCAGHPDAEIAEAAQALLVELKRRAGVR